MRTQHFSKRFHPRRHFTHRRLRAHKVAPVTIHEEVAPIYTKEEPLINLPEKQGGSLRDLSRELSKIVIKSKPKKLSRRKYIF